MRLVAPNGIPKYNNLFDMKSFLLRSPFVTDNAIQCAKKKWNRKEKEQLQSILEIVFHFQSVDNYDLGVNCECQMGVCFSQ